jgi:16S rRNA processing protein RimM
VPEKQEEEWATIGQVVALFGIGGELKVRLLTSIPDRLQQLAAIYLNPEHQRLGIEKVRPYKGEMVILKLSGIDDANAAEPLCKQDLQIPLSQLAELPLGIYYQHDILGLTVATLADRRLGHIVDIIETGGNDVYVIQGSDGKQVLIPAIKDVVKQVDLLRKTMYIDPLPGLLEPATREDEEVRVDEAGESGESAETL